MPQGPDTPYLKAFNEAYRKNIEAHDAAAGPTEASLKRVPIRRGYQRLAPDAYGDLWADHPQPKLFLALRGGHWCIGTISYYAPQERFEFDGGSHPSQVEHLQELYEIDLPHIPEWLVEKPERDAFEEDEEDDE